LVEQLSLIIPTSKHALSLCLQLWLFSC
jgi:hypothetical protein